MNAPAMSYEQPLPALPQKKHRLDGLQLDGEHCGQCRQLSTGASAKRAWRAKLPLRTLFVANVVYGLILLTLLVSNAAGPEWWWPGSLNLYLPQWLWAIPGLLLLPLTLGFARRWVWVPVAALLCVLGPIMGFCGNKLLPGTTALRGVMRLRVMTYNVKWDSRNEQAIIQDVHAFHPDILQLQDADGVLRGELGRALAGWNLRVSDQYIIASRLPLPDMEWRDISVPGSLRHCVRCTIPFGSRSVTVYNVHLLSPRTGLVSVRHHQVSELVSNADARLLEADLLAGYIRQEQGPTLLTGDLNAPVQSLVCRQLLDAGLHDAFSEAGSGYGYTYGRYTPLGRPYVRIDHIMASREWQVQRCWVGNSQGSDHCPVIADLVLP